MNSEALKMFEKASFKVTNQRKAIADVLFSSNEHLSADEIFKKISSIDPNISIATVYRTLLLFEEFGIVKRLDLGEGRSLYEAAGSQKGHHHHLVDLESGKIIEFYDPEIEDLKERIARRLGYKLIDHRLELYGIPIK
ncbi:Transcriptional repressor [Candidatus Cyrtobacter comes]|uniref:Ferric uptake regulation protein n=1 Tax=Candidatus Cyrtobacter comes TaxID=675776 RepID=A0ABU5L8J9_9RICK|nr:Fur family transcriptional regulator [Candidatus Cyrtobacter comes]MDZ5762452.1 Transcriptional repressor [Candidatus Cyrtobacter comes]